MVLVVLMMLTMGTTMATFLPAMAATMVTIVMCMAVV